jgi:hypothetical protein
MKDLKFSFPPYPTDYYPYETEVCASNGNPRTEPLKIGNVKRHEAASS